LLEKEGVIGQPQTTPASTPARKTEEILGCGEEKEDEAL